jgi:prolyl oligopeptidase
MTQVPRRTWRRSAQWAALSGLLLFAAAVARCRSAAGPDPRSFAPPATEVVEVTDDYHGTPVSDPYRWLEDLDDSRTEAWVDAQARAAEAFLDRLPRREHFRQRLTALWNHPRMGPPIPAGPRWIYSWNDGLQNQSVLYLADSPEDRGRVLLDPNTLSEDGTVALGPYEVSVDGRYLAFSTSTRGSDWREWQVLDLERSALLDDRLSWSKSSGAAWTHDAKGFFYLRYPRPPAEDVREAPSLAPELCYHELGEPQDRDLVVYARPDQPTWSFHPSVTDDGRFLIVTVRAGTDVKNGLLWADLGQQPFAPKPLLMTFDARYSVVGSDGQTLYLRTDKEAPRGRVIAVDVADPDPARWREAVPQAAETLAGADLIADRLVLLYLHDAHHLVRLHGMDGKLERALSLPKMCSVGQIDGRRGQTEMFFSVSTFVQPASVLRYRFSDAELTRHWQPELDFDPGAFEARQVSFQSRDGTRVPMFIVHRTGLVLDGSHPTYLYGYGGFGVSLTPSYSAATVAWLEAGGVYAQPTLRGGGEFGEEWHRAGKLANKQSVFDDFIAAAEYLIRNAYTTPASLGIGGASNGGLLAAAALLQHPALFAAAVVEAGVLDMLRYHRFTVGWAWESEYGTSADPAMFPVLHLYSPVHNVRDGVAYPATLIMTGDYDDRVVPSHSYKFAAAMQARASSAGPVVLRIDRHTGHGAGKPTAKRIAAAADRLAFLSWALSD